MPNYEIPPTKTNLLKLRRELRFATEGYELLEQKRQILVVELMSLMDRTADAQRDVEEKLADAYSSLEKAVMEMGRKSVSHHAIAVNMKSEISLSERRVMGVGLPVVRIDYEDYPPYYSPGDTSFWMDDAVSKFKELLKLVGRLAEMRISLMRLAREVNKTIRRVNALEKIAIPDYEETIKYIGNTLDELERESFATMKLVKERLGNKRGGEAG